MRSFRWQGVDVVVPALTLVGSSFVLWLVQSALIKKRSEQEAQKSYIEALERENRVLKDRLEASRQKTAATQEMQGIQRLGANMSDGPLSHESNEYSSLQVSQGVTRRAEDYMNDVSFFRRTISDPSGQKRLTANALRSEAGRWGVTTCCAYCGSDNPFNNLRGIRGGTGSPVSQTSKQSYPGSVAMCFQRLIGPAYACSSEVRPRTDELFFSSYAEQVAVASLFAQKKVAHAAEIVAMYRWELRRDEFHCLNILWSMECQLKIRNQWSNVLAFLGRPVQPGNPPTLSAANDVQRLQAAKNYYAPDGVF
jgi:hypothetical protein